MANKKSTKVNPFSLSRPAPVIVEKTFTDPNIPGQEISFKFKIMDQAELILAYELSQHYVDQYLGSEGNPPKMVFPVVGGYPVTLSRSLIETACCIFSMQADKNDDSYTFEDLVAMSVTLPTLWVQLGHFINVDLAKSGENSKNA